MDAGKVFQLNECFNLPNTTQEGFIIYPLTFLIQVWDSSFIVLWGYIRIMEPPSECNLASGTDWSPIKVIRSDKEVLSLINRKESLQWPVDLLCFNWPAVGQPTTFIQPQDSVSAVAENWNLTRKRGRRRILIFHKVDSISGKIVRSRIWCEVSKGCPN